MKPVRIESLLAGVLNVGTWLALVVIAAGLILSLFQERTLFGAGSFPASSFGLAIPVQHRRLSPRSAEKQLLLRCPWATLCDERHLS
jgi:hypothetical protein